VRRPADEIGGKKRHALLQKNSRFRAHLDAVEIENLFAFLDTRFNGLPAVVMVEPGWQILSDRVMAKVTQSAVLEGPASIEAFQGNIEWIRTTL